MVVAPAKPNAFAEIAETCRRIIERMEADGRVPPPNPEQDAFRARFRQDPSGKVWFDAPSNTVKWGFPDGTELRAVGDVVGPVSGKALGYAKKPDGSVILNGWPKATGRVIALTDGPATKLRDAAYRLCHDLATHHNRKPAYLSLRTAPNDWKAGWDACIAAMNRGADVLVIDDVWVKHDRPRLRFLAEMLIARQGRSVVYLGDAPVAKPGEADEWAAFAELFRRDDGLAVAVGR